MTPMQAIAVVAMFATAGVMALSAGRGGTDGGWRTLRRFSAALAFVATLLAVLTVLT